MNLDFFWKYWDYIALGLLMLVLPPAVLILFSSANSSDFQANLFGPTGTAIDGFEVVISDSIVGNNVNLSFSADIGADFNPGTVVDGVSIRVLFPVGYNPINPQVVNNSVGVLFDPVVFVDVGNRKRATITFYELSLDADGGLFDFSFDYDSFSSHYVNISGEVLTESENVYDLGEEEYLLGEEEEEEEEPPGGGPTTPPGEDPPPEEPEEVSVFIDVLAHPEKRFPSTNNWTTRGSLALYALGSGDSSYLFEATTDNYGMASLEEDVAEGNYDISFKGLSHLTKFLRGVSILSGINSLDFTFGGTFNLLAGDIALNKDDYVNSLDLVSAVMALYANNEHADLNRDFFVNSLDLSIAVANLYKQGEKPV